MSKTILFLFVLVPLLLANTAAANALALESKQSMIITDNNGNAVSCISMNGHKHCISNFSCDGTPQVCDPGYASYDKCLQGPISG